MAGGAQSALVKRREIVDGQEELYAARLVSMYEYIVFTPEPNAVGAVHNLAIASVPYNGRIFIVPMHAIGQSQRLLARARQYANMNPRTGPITASRVDLTLILLPAITWLEASCMLADSGGPADVAARVMALPLERRALDLPSSSG